jgi:hypothetical protein
LNCCQGETVKFLINFANCSKKAVCGGVSGSAEGDDGEESAGERALFAVAEEEVRAAGGAEIAREDVLILEASGE